MTDYTNNDTDKTTNIRRVALITGASRGLGETVATFLAGQGFDLVLTARGAQALKETATQLESWDNRVLALPGDIADSAHRRQLIQAAEQFGRLDFVFNNASLLGPSPMPTLVDYPLEQLEQVFEINVFAQMGLVQEALPLLKKSRGLVVNVSSDAAVGGYEGWGGYGASKAALDLISLTFANELREDGIGVVSVDPGDMRTQMHQDAFPGEDISDRPLPDVTLPFWAWLIAQNPLDISGQRLQAQAETWMVKVNGG
ncbi:SDR family oxidoreductase [Chloroflexi bacterium TSY]|nr:SDR family oxidoreductase [Chloroflexi bacterium TSY]